jgi:hypothetical protein
VTVRMSLSLLSLKGLISSRGFITVAFSNQFRYMSRWCPGDPFPFRNIVTMLGLSLWDRQILSMKSCNILWTTCEDSVNFYFNILCKNLTLGSILWQSECPCPFYPWRAWSVHVASSRLPSPTNLGIWVAGVLVILFLQNAVPAVCSECST